MNSNFSFLRLLLLFRASRSVYICIAERIKKTSAIPGISVYCEILCN